MVLFSPLNLGHQADVTTLHSRSKVQFLEAAKVDEIGLYITGGSGAGASTIGLILAEKLNLHHLDSDTFFHKPTDPPFQEQYSNPKMNVIS